MRLLVFLFPLVSGGWVSLGIICILVVLSLDRLLFPPSWDINIRVTKLIELIYNNLQNNYNNIVTIYIHLRLNI